MPTMRIAVSVVLLASVGHAQSTIDEQSKDLLERMQAVMSDPSFQDQARQIAKPIESIMSEVERLQTAFSDPSLQKQGMRMIEPVKAMMADPKFQEEAKRVAEQLIKVMEDPAFLEEAKHIAEPLAAIIEDPDSQDPEHVVKQLQAVMADPNFQKQAKRITEPVRDMISNDDVQEQARHVIGQMDEVIADPNFQKEAKRISEPMKAMIADAEQIREVMADPTFQEEAKRMAEQMQALLDEEPVRPPQKSLASLLLAANPSLPGTARSSPRSFQRGRLVMEEDIAGKVKDIIAEQLGVDAEKVVPDASFTEDLGADSLDAVELIMAIEEAFDIEIPDEEAEKMTTPGDCVTAIKSKMS